MEILAVRRATVRLTSYGAVTVILAVWLLPLSGPAVSVTAVAVPPWPWTGMAAVVAPIGTVTLAGTTTAGSLLVRRTSVGVGCGGAIVAVRVPVAPLERLNVLGLRPVTVGAIWRSRRAWFPVSLTRRRPYPSATRA